MSILAGSQSTIEGCSLFTEPPPRWRIARHYARLDQGKLAARIFLESYPLSRRKSTYAQRALALLQPAGERQLRVAGRESWTKRRHGLIDDHQNGGHPSELASI